MAATAATGCGGGAPGTGPSGAGGEATTLDFDFILGRGTTDCAVYAENGFTLTVPRTPSITGSVRINEFVIAGTGIVHPSFGFTLESLHLAKEDGLLFTLLSVDATEFFTTNPPRMGITGVRSDSSTVTAAIVLDGNKGLQRFDLSGLTNLESAIFGGPDSGTSDLIVLDNIRVDSGLRGRLSTPRCDPPLR